MEIEFADFGEKKLVLSRKKWYTGRASNSTRDDSSRVKCSHFIILFVKLYCKWGMTFLLNSKSLSLYKNLSHSLFFPSLCSLANSSTTTKVPSVGIDTAADDRKNTTFLPQFQMWMVVPRVACSSWAAAVVIVSSRLVSRATSTQEL